MDHFADFIKPSLVIRVDGLWKFYASDYNGYDAMTWSFEFGRRTEGLYYERKSYLRRRVAYFVDPLQRDLMALVREHGIPTPS